MQKHQFENLEPPRRSGTVIPYIIIALLTLVIVIAVLIFFFSPETVTDLRSATGLTPAQEQSEMLSTNVGSDTPSASEQESTVSGEGQGAGLEGSAAQTAGQDSSGLTGSSETGSASTDPDNSLTGLPPCDLLADNIEAFFNTLDTRDYIQEFKLDSPSVEYFPRLIQKLIDNPPIVSGETDDLFTILQNTAHFFRIIGKKNIFVLKGILDRERQTFEQVLADFYQLTGHPDCLQKRFNLNIYEDSLYSYAGFFLNTMGGRLYLFRRDSMSRMVVSYYAILIIDQANREGRNKYGIDIKDAIDNLIIEIESSRIELQMRDIYLDKLYDLKISYQ